MERDPAYERSFLEQAKQELSKSGITPEHIEDYFQSGTDPQSVFALKYEEKYSMDVREKFYKEADQFALDKMRDWLGF